IRPMLVSERLEMRLRGNPEPEKDKGYTMYPNWQLRMEITDAKALEARLSKMEEALTLLHKYPFHSADCRCKQWGGKIDPENCGQCRAREVLAALPEHLK
ncbi:hypothetical protein LCGC14_2614160, partial [marine sediment metagenome]